MKYTASHLSGEDYAKLLANAWITSEAPNRDVNVSKAELVRMFKAAEPSLLMTEEEIHQLSELNNPVTIYRGVTDYNADDINALSWTLNPEKALWFSKRFNSEGTVYEAQIDKTHIIALFNTRDESEIIVEPKYLENISEYEDQVFGLTITH